MCTVSMVGDHYRDLWQPKPWFPNVPAMPFPSVPATGTPEISRAEFEELKRQVAEMKELLKRAKEYDARNNEPDCEIDEKMDLLRKVAKLVGVSLDDVIGKPAAPAPEQGGG